MALTVYSPDVRRVPERLIHRPREGLTLGKLLGAVRNWRCVTVEYATPIDAEPGWFELKGRNWQISHMWKEDDRIYLLAYDDLREELRTFRLDRITVCEISCRVERADPGTVWYPACWETRKERPRPEYQPGFLSHPPTYVIDKSRDLAWLTKMTNA